MSMSRALQGRKTSKRMKAECAGVDRVSDVGTAQDRQDRIADLHQAVHEAIEAAVEVRDDYQLVHDRYPAGLRASGPAQAALSRAEDLADVLADLEDALRVLARLDGEA